MNRNIVKMKRMCPNCNGLKKFSEKYDADYCPKCMIWLSHKCGSKTCEFCSKRPKINGENIKTLISDSQKEREEWKRVIKEMEDEKRHS